jgi:hypothetical protein
MYCLVLVADLIVRRASVHFDGGPIHGHGFASERSLVEKAGPSESGPADGTHREIGGHLANPRRKPAEPRPGYPA